MNKKPQNPNQDFEKSSNQTINLQSMMNQSMYAPAQASTQQSPKQASNYAPKNPTEIADWIKTVEQHTKKALATDRCSKISVTPKKKPVTFQLVFMANCLRVATKYNNQTLDASLMFKQGSWQHSKGNKAPLSPEEESQIKDVLPLTKIT